MQSENLDVQSMISSLENTMRVLVEETKNRILNNVDQKFKDLNQTKKSGDSQIIKNAIESLSISLRKSTEDSKTRILNEVNTKIQSIVDEKMADLRSSLAFEIQQKEESFDPPPLNYEILPPEGTPDFDNQKSAVFMEIPFDSEDLHVLGLQNGQLYWVKTEDC